MHQNLTHQEYAKLLNKIGNVYMPVQKPKKKLNLKQIFYLKKNNYK